MGVGVHTHRTTRYFNTPKNRCKAHKCADKTLPLNIYVKQSWKPTLKYQNPGLYVQTLKLQLTFQHNVLSLIKKSPFWCQLVEMNGKQINQYLHLRITVPLTFLQEPTSGRRDTPPKDLIHHQLYTYNTEKLFCFYQVPSTG